MTSSCCDGCLQKNCTEEAEKRRFCVYNWIEYPTHEKEVEIVHLKQPGIAAALAGQLVAFVQQLRHKDICKRPGVAEALDWAEALIHLQAKSLETAVVKAILGINS